MPEYEGSDIGDGGVIGDGEWGYRRPSWAYWRRNGLIGNSSSMGLGSEPSRMVIGVGCRSHREWFVMIGFGFGFGPSQMVIGDSLESYRRWLSVTDWVFIGDSGVRLDGDEAQWTKA